MDNGAPSTDYPAPHPPLPRLVNGMKGPVLTAPKVYLIFYPSYALFPLLKILRAPPETLQSHYCTVREIGGQKPHLTPPLAKGRMGGVVCMK